MFPLLKKYPPSKLLANMEISPSVIDENYYDAKTSLCSTKLTMQSTFRLVQGQWGKRASCDTRVERRTLVMFARDQGGFVEVVYVVPTFWVH